MDLLAVTDHDWLVLVVILCVAIILLLVLRR